MRRFVPWFLLGLLASATFASAVIGYSAPIVASDSEQVNLVSPFDLVGLPITTAQQLARDDGVELSILAVPSQAPSGQVIGQDPNYPTTPTVVVSTGPLRDRFKILTPASVPPVHGECAGGLRLFEDGNVGPLTCHGGINVAAWERIAQLQLPVMKLGRSATEAQVVRAICTPSPTAVLGDSGYQLATTYYGWEFGDQLYDDYVYGLNGKHCPSS
jgi:hypothetical protein